MKREANSAARSASGPSAESRAEGLASSRSEGCGIAAPRPPKQRPSRPRKSSTPKCSRDGASTKTLFRSDILGEQRHRLLLPRPGGLIHDDLKSGELLLDLPGGNQVGASGQDGSLQHRMP